MIKETKIYLETTIPNVATEDGSSDRKIITQLLLGEINKGYYTAYISALVLREINRTESEKRKKQLLESVHGIEHRFIEITPTIENLADEYVKAGIIPADYKDDATHVAAATLAGVPTLVTWNLKHLANIKTMDAVNGINIPRGYPQIRIFTPYELVGHLLDED